MNDLVLLVKLPEHGRWSVMAFTRCATARRGCVRGGGNGGDEIVVCRSLLLWEVKCAEVTSKKDGQKQTLSLSSLHRLTFQKALNSFIQPPILC